ncbi:MAG: citrate lyase subunit alpha, partial [Lachnospiraceae bacterium]|nr:citrate lyase subunit alpha [Lachnospiraceae bacterium]
MSKVISSIEEALKNAGLKDGMTISFHHHMRNGDYVLNKTLEVIEKMGVKNLTLNASSIFDSQADTIGRCIKEGVITNIKCSYMASGMGRKIVDGIMENPVEFRTHGGRASDMESGKIHTDIAIIAAPTCDEEGNATGKMGKASCGSLGYAFSDSEYSDKVIMVTDNLVKSLDKKYISLDGKNTDFVVAIDCIGDPNGIVSGTTKITRDPIGLLMAQDAANVIRYSGLLKDGFNFQTGAGGASLAAAKYLKDIMLENNIKGGFGLGGITSYMVDMLKAGCFQKLYDVQCFDLGAVESITNNPEHIEISAKQYAGPNNKDACVNNLDVVILGATEIDTDFNVNVHTDSNGIIIGGSGGHSDTAAGAKLAMIIAPLVRARLPIVTDRVSTISTKGDTIDVFVTQYGVAVNPKNKELIKNLKDNKVNVVDINELKKIAETISGVPQKFKASGRVVAKVISRDGEVIDEIHAL